MPRHLRGGRRAAMPARAAALALLTLVVGSSVAALGGCGQRGPLYLPEPPAGAAGGAAGAAGASTPVAANGAAAQPDDEDGERERDER